MTKSNTLDVWRGSGL